MAEWRGWEVKGGVLDPRGVLTLNSAHHYMLRFRPSSLVVVPSYWESEAGAGRWDVLKRERGKGDSGNHRTKRLH